MSTNYLPKSYDSFKPIVAEIKSGNNTDFLGGGAESSVWRAALDNKYYAVKLTKSVSIRGRPRNVVKATESKITSGLRGLGIDGLEQLQTGSLEDGVIIYDYVDATKVSDMSEKDIGSVTKKHISSLWRTVVLATRAGIEFDSWNTDGNNVFFSNETGFTLIDYWANGEVSAKRNWSNVIESLGEVGLRLINENRMV